MERLAGAGLTINGDLRSVSLVPPALATAEAQVKATWGGFRDQAMIWTAAGSEEQALAAATAVFQTLKQSGEPLVSLAPLLPPEAVQRANRRALAGLLAGRGRTPAILRPAATGGRRLRLCRRRLRPLHHEPRRAGAPVTLASLKAAGLGSLVEALVVREGEKMRLLTLAPDTPRVAALLQGEKPCRGAAGLPGPLPRQRSAAPSAATSRAFLLGATLVNVLLLVLLYRQPLKILVSALPVATGPARHVRHHGGHRDRLQPVQRDRRHPGHRPGGRLRHLHGLPGFRGARTGGRPGGPRLAG